MLGNLLVTVIGTVVFLNNRALQCVAPSRSVGYRRPPRRRQSQHPATQRCARFGARRGKRDAAVVTSGHESDDEEARQPAQQHLRSTLASSVTCPTEEFGRLASDLPCRPRSSGPVKHIIPKRGRERLAFSTNEVTLPSCRERALRSSFLNGNHRGSLHHLVRPSDYQIPELDGRVSPGFANLAD